MTNFKIQKGEVIVGWATYYSNAKLLHVVLMDDEPGKYGEKYKHETHELTQWMTDIKVGEFIQSKLPGSTAHIYKT